MARRDRRGNALRVRQRSEHDLTASDAYAGPMALRVGIQLPEVERDVRWPEYLAMAGAAEEVGFDSIWLGDHLLFRGDGRPERGPWRRGHCSPAWPQ